MALTCKPSIDARTATSPGATRAEKDTVPERAKVRMTAARSVKANRTAVTIVTKMSTLMSALKSLQQAAPTDHSRPTTTCVALWKKARVIRDQLSDRWHGNDPGLQNDAIAVDGATVIGVTIGGTTIVTTTVGVTTEDGNHVETTNYNSESGVIEMRLTS